MKYLAHSAKNNCQPQPYAAHIEGVYEKAVRYAREAEVYALKTNGLLAGVVGQSAVLHDLGKLDDENQAVLRGEASSRHLPVNHVEAGVAALLKQGSEYSALNVYAHHKGLPEMENEEVKEELLFRDDHPAVRKHTDEVLETLILRHQQEVSLSWEYKGEFYEGEESAFFRIMLSCLADADHMDTAMAYGQVMEDETMPKLRAEERLALLDQYVSGLGEADERSQLRREMYWNCHDSEQKGGFCACDSPVGSGKTLAVMAHLLKQAAARKARHIFVVLPYTSIITQSVEIYRKVLVLPGEDPERVVAELHHRADFQDMDVRYLSSLWRAPIIITTAVAFFETLASNKPSILRRFHELPGSMIFIDESHAALPVRLLPLAWHWMNVLADEWNCYWVLASGSLVRFWKLDTLCAIGIEQPEVPELVDRCLHERLMKYEKNRVAFCWRPDPLSRDELCEWVQSMPGPRLLILNTVQKAAVVASDLRQRYGRDCVEHLSTALTALDRSVTINHVKERLRNSKDRDWTLVATSCVEAGVDFSFRTGFREVFSLLSLLQSAGRINRHGDTSYAEMWSFTMQDSSVLGTDGGSKASIEILTRYFKEQTAITPELSTSFMEAEIKGTGKSLVPLEKLVEADVFQQFQTVADQFKVIDEDTVIAVVDPVLVSQISEGRGNWIQLQKNSVSIRRGKIREWKMVEIAKGIYQWTLSYEPFLGYMDGVLGIERGKREFLSL